MKTFIDLNGASGRSYRFRLWMDGHPHQPIGGIYTYVRGADDGLEILGIGATNDLSAARRPLARLERLGTAQVYTRLNIPRGPREAEHADLVAHYRPQFIGNDAP